MSHPTLEVSTLLLGDCLERMAALPDASVDAIICDPPYPEIDRPYGRMTEAEWWSLMMGVCRESRRILKPKGSAVFILQPNSRKVGSMRGWLFRFQAWACDEWNMVQDAWWWNVAAVPMTKNDPHKLRTSVKACVWLGPPECYRDSREVPWSESDRNKAARASGRWCGFTRSTTSRTSIDQRRMVAAAEATGGVTPFNLLPIANTNSATSGGAHGHGAATPEPLCDWWVRYISPDGGTVCDPFMGSGTTGLAALKRGRKFIGIERDAGYFATAVRRISELQASTPLFAGVAS